MLKKYTTDSVTAAMTKDFEKAKSCHEAKALQLNTEADSLVLQRASLTTRILELDEMATEQQTQANLANLAIETIQSWSDPQALAA